MDFLSEFTPQRARVACLRVYPNYLAHSDVLTASLDAPDSLFPWYHYVTRQPLHFQCSLGYHLHFQEKAFLHNSTCFPENISPSRNECSWNQEEIHYSLRIVLRGLSVAEVP